MIIYTSDHAEWRCLLASEVVHLMCLVPQFFESLQTNEGMYTSYTVQAYCSFTWVFQGLLKMTAIATKDPNLSDVIAEIMWKVQAKGVKLLLVDMLVSKSYCFCRVMCGKCTKTLQATSLNLPVKMYWIGKRKVLLQTSPVYTYTGPHHNYCM